MSDARVDIDVWDVNSMISSLPMGSLLVRRHVLRDPFNDAIRTIATDVYVIVGSSDDSAGGVILDVMQMSCLLDEATNFTSESYPRMTKLWLYYYKDEMFTSASQTRQSQITWDVVYFDMHPHD